MLSKNNFTLTSSTPYSINNYEIILKGKCIKTDTTMKFVCDSHKVKNKNLLTDKVKQFSNIPAIGQGQTFKRKDNFFIPNHIINDATDQNLKVPNGLFASYYRGDGYGSHILEIRQDHTYKFTQHTCMDNSFEEGTWTENNNMITLISAKKEWTMLDWLTDNKQFFVDTNFLIGKKTIVLDKATISETYFYLSKLSE